jgi:hypothetical protein
MNRRRLITTTLLSVLLVASAVSAFAQPQGRGDRRGAGPGPSASVLPTVEAMAEAVGADAEQRAILAEARLAFVEALKEGPRGRRGGPGEKGLHQGPPADGPARPMMTFLETAATGLDVQEMSALVDLLETTRPERPRGDQQGLRKGRGQSADSPKGARRGDGPGRGGLEAAEHSLVHQLDLDEVQTTRVKTLYASTNGALRALAAQEGEADLEMLKAEATRVREKHQAELQEILTEAQFDQLLQLRAVRRVENAQRGTERAEKRLAQQLSSLTAILDLDGGQQKSVEGILTAAQESAMQSRAERWAQGGPMASLFTERGMDRDAVGDAIAGELKPAQRELFAKIRTLGVMAGGPSGGQGHGPGPGHGQGPRNGSGGGDCNHGSRR